MIQFMTELNAKFDRDEITALEYINAITESFPWHAAWNRVKFTIESTLFMYNVNPEHPNIPHDDESIEKYAIYLSTLFSGDDEPLEDLHEKLEEYCTNEIERLF